MQLLHARGPMLILTLLSVTIYLWAQYDQGWIPHDEGLLGQSATRILDGELPHIDFDDPYTGGQAMLHALSMKLFGVSSLSMRLMLLLFSVAFATITYLIAHRLVPPWCAAFTTWLVIAWSVPNYFAPLPSWYNLFFAVFGTFSLLKFDETNHRGWLIFAGVMGGLSFLIKLAGLYYIAGGLLFLVYRDQQLASCDLTQSNRRRWFTALVTVSLICFVILLAMLVRTRASLMDLVHFVMPGAALAVFLIFNQWRQDAGTSAERMKRLAATVMLFAIGAGLPLLIYLIPYAIRSALPAFIDGVFILPQKRMQFADYPMPPLGSIIAVIPYAMLLIVPMLTHRRFNPIWEAAVAWTVCAFAILLASQAPVYEQLWNSTRPLVPLMVLVGIAVLLQTPARAPSIQDRTLFLLLAMTSMVSLVQFPYSFGIYFCYTIPLGILALVAIVMKQDSPPIQLHWVVAVFFLGFAMVWLNHGRVQGIGVRFVADNQNTRLPLSRCGLRVSSSQALLYEQVVESVQRHSSEGSAIYATVDCPEIYFLANRKNPTRSFYEFFEPDFAGPEEARVARIIALLERDKVEVVVFHWQGEFSGSVAMGLAQAIATRFPNVEHFLRQTEMGPASEPTFSVAWRELTP